MENAKVQADSVSLRDSNPDNVGIFDVANQLTCMGRIRNMPRDDGEGCAH